MTTRLCTLCISLLMLNALAGAATLDPADASSLPTKDAYGCVGEEGYSWCVKLKQCVRPSKILIENNLELTPENFHDFCQTKSQ